eukprot:9946281-Lingulodinium_polyedra.AAC.1
MLQALPAQALLQAAGLRVQRLPSRSPLEGLVVARLEDGVGRALSADLLGHVLHDLLREREVL